MKYYASLALLVYLVLSSFSFSNADELYYTHTDGQNLLGADYNRVGPNFVPEAQFSFPTPGIDGSIAAVPRGSNQFSLFYPARIGTTNNFLVQRSNVSFDDSAHLFNRTSVKNFVT
jgi:hypothetical protein